MSEKRDPLPPGSIIGILGGGQLGRMTAMAAAHMGYRAHIFAPERDNPAAQVSPDATAAEYDDEAALAAFADAVDVVTFEFENVPHAAASFLAGKVLVRPSPRVLEVCQDRLKEKDFLASIDVATARYAEATGADSVARGLRDIGRPAVLKSARMGYDGKGQVMIGTGTDPEQAWAEMTASAPGGQSDIKGILEGHVDFRLEISVIVARNAEGQLATYVPVENRHKNHILDETIAPARIPSNVADKAEATARHIADKFQLEGLLAVEMFVTHDERVLVNELAPRPHNSGHWTMDACLTSQFEQAVRAICGLPLGATERHSDAVMKNLIGDEVNDWRKAFSDSMGKLHVYGKAEARPGRKMGHITRLGPRR